MRITRSIGAALVALTAGSVLVTTPASASTPTCAPPAPMVIGSKQGLTVGVRPCAVATDAVAYRLTVYRHGEDSSHHPFAPVTIDLPKDRLRARIPDPRDTVGGIMSSYTFRARAVGAGGELGPLGPTSAYAHPPFATASAAVNELWRDVLGANPTSAQRAADISLINRKGIYGYSTRLVASSGGQKVSEVARIYRTVLDRVPDQAGLVYWTARHRSGWPLSRIAGQFLASSAYQRTHGTLSNAQFVQSTYHQATGSNPSPSSAAAWTAQLDAGTRSRGELAAAFSESAAAEQSQRMRVAIITWFSDLWRTVPTQTVIDAYVRELEYETGFVPLVALGGERFVDRVGVAGPPLINMAVMPDGKVGSAYSRSPLLWPGTGTKAFTWTVTGVPAGLAVSPNGRVYGTPTQSGDFTTTFRVTDATGRTDTRSYSYTIGP